MRRLLLSMLFSIFAAASISAQTTAFTYQGSLKDGANPANGNFDFEFKLFDALSAGTQQGSTQQRLNVAVANGVFAVSLDFGAGTLPGANRYLEIAVRTAGGGTFTLLTPRQPVNSAPYSVRSLNSTTADLATNATQLGGVAANQYITTANGSTNFIQNTTNQQAANFNINGNGAIGGNLGIGTAAPVGNLHINVPGSGNPISALTLNVGTFGTGTNATNSYFFKARDLGIGSSAFLIRGDGNVGIATDTPTERLDVIGNIKASGTISGRGAVPWQVVSGLSQQALPNNGYLTTNDAQVIITLPANPNIGDIVRISSTGTGGWKIAQNAGQSIFTPSIGGFKSTWTPRENLRNWASVASSADGTKLAAVAGANGLIYTSTDSGVNWTPRESNRPWQTIASSSDGNKLVAVLSSGQIYTSTDSGANWTPRESNRSWTSVASSADGNKLVAVDTGLGCAPMPCEPVGRIYTSTDSGVTWTPRESDRNWSAVASSADGTKLVAGVNPGPGSIYTSTDSGLTWTGTGTGGLVTALASSSDGSKLAACLVGASLITSSDSGVTWTPRPEVTNCQSVASSADGKRLVVAANRIYTSSDSGVTWTAQEATINWFAAASSADGNKLVVAAISNRIYTSGNALMTTAGTAGYLTGGQLSAIELQYVGNGRFLPVSSTGTIFGN